MKNRVIRTHQFKLAIPASFFIHRRLSKKFLCFFFLFAFVRLDAQPVISSFSPSSTTAGATVTITGQNFSNQTAGNAVYFGAVKGTVTAASTTSILVTVPAGATYCYISVSNTNGTGYSNKFFTLVQGVTLSAGSFDSRKDFNANGSFLTGIACGDFDGDGKPEIVSSNWASQNISVYLNTSTTGNLSFLPGQVVATGRKPDVVAVGDLNHDGKLDMAVPSADDQLISVLINNSTTGNLSFSRTDVPTSSSSYPRSVALSDVDGDGLLDIIEAEGDFYNSMQIGVFRNISIGALIKFAPPVYLTNQPQNFCIGMNDLDGDGKSDLVVINDDGTMRVSRNISTPGTVSFGPAILYPTKGRPGAQLFTIGDLDGDGKAEVLISQTSTIAIYRNTSVPGSISFATPTTVSCSYPMGLALGDLDGDGKADLAVASFLFNAVVFKNNSVPGTIALDPPMIYPARTTADLYDICITDVDGDGYPNLATTINQLNQMEVFYPSAPKPVLNLGPDVTICEGDSLILTSSIPNAGYHWNTGSAARTIVIKQAGSYWLDVTGMNYTVSDTIRVNIQPRPVFSLGPDQKFCSGDSIRLKSGLTGLHYLWQDGSNLDSFRARKTGQYWEEVEQNGCRSRDTVNIFAQPVPSLDLGKDTTICGNDSLVLDATNPSIIDYLWQNGDAQPKFAVHSSGIFWLQVRDGSGCSTTDSIKVQVNPLPDFSLGKDTSICAGFVLSYQFRLSNAQYLWSNGIQSAGFTISQPGLYWLQVRQNGCSRTDSLSVSVRPLPLVSLGADTTLCENSSLSVDVSYPNAHYLWSTQDTLSQITIHEAGQYWVRSEVEGCIKADTILVRYDLLPRFNLGKDTTICNNQSFLLDPGITQGSFEWQDGSFNRTYIVSDTGLYILRVSNACGEAVDSIRISKGACSFLMPNGFTPNHDGLNDLFRVPYPQLLKSFSMKLYNRWGEIVFTTHDAYQGWDGRLLGKEQPTGNYIWIIDLVDQNGRRASYRGNVLLIR